MKLKKRIKLLQEEIELLREVKALREQINLLPNAPVPYQPYMPFAQLVQPCDITARPMPDGAITVTNTQADIDGLAEIMTAKIREAGVQC